MPKIKKSKKKTVQKKGYEVNRVERLVLYTVGKSSTPMSAYEIQKNVVKQMPGYDHQKYTYTVLKQLVPHQQEIPHKLLFKIDDFFDSQRSVREISNDEKKDKLIRRVTRNVFKSYWHLLDGNEEDWECSIPTREKSAFVIRISHKKEKNPRLRFVIRRMKKSNRWSSKLYYKHSEIPLCEIREKGTTKIYSTVVFPYLHFKHYLDTVFRSQTKGIDSSKNSIDGMEVRQTVPENTPLKSSQFVLNVRGLLRYIFLNAQKTETEYSQMNEVIETLAQVDVYHDLENEFKAMDPMRFAATSGNNIFIEKKTSNIKIKERFPFLSYYNEIKRTLPENFAVDILYEIATDLQDNLEKMNIFDLKYEITQKFLEEIERIFLGSNYIIPLDPLIACTNSDFNTTRTAYGNYQHEIRTYIKARKEKEINLIEKRERHVQEELEIIDFKQKVLEHIENEPKDIISIIEIVGLNGAGIASYGLSRTQNSIIKDICEYQRRDYQFGWYHLFKRTLIDEIANSLVPEMDYETVKKILMEMGIHEQDVILEILSLTKYNKIFDKEMQIYRIVKKNIPKLKFGISSDNKIVLFEEDKI